MSTQTVKTVKTQKDENGRPKMFIFLAVAVLIGGLIYRDVDLLKPLKQFAFKSKIPEVDDKHLKFWGVCLWNWNPTGNLMLINRVFDLLNYKAVDGFKGDDWDFAWTIEYPYDSNRTDLYNGVVKPLKPHQKVNHFPSINYITSKSFLTTRNRDIEAILPAFRFPRQIEQFKAYVKVHPESRFVVKHQDNRGIKLVNNSDIEFSENQQFYQLFMERPMLLDGKAMDFSNYVVITSVNPLRIYRIDHEFYLRFCKEEYLPFDPLNTDKYVVSEQRTELRNIPTLDFYRKNFGYSVKRSFEEIFKAKGHDIKEFWRKVDDTIVRIIAANEEHIVRDTLKLYNSTHHFSELVRVDMLIDEDFVPHLTEVNMSPGLTQRVGQTPSTLYQQVIYNYLRLVGASSNLDLKSIYDTKISDMITNSRNIAIAASNCTTNLCHENCSPKECLLCIPCLKSQNLRDLHEGYKEHVRQGDFKRIFPSKPHFDDDFIKTLSPRNQISAKWFMEMCKEKPEWC